MPTFDYFVSSMKCHKCGAISSADESTNMQTKICLHQKAFLYGVNSILDIDIGNIEESGYLCIWEPTSQVSFTLLDTWECSNCDESFNWALITIENKVIKSIAEIRLTDEVAQRANYISDMCEFLGYKVKNNAIVYCDAEPSADGL